LTDQAVISLPNVPDGNPHFDEWKMRKASAKSVGDYLKSRSFKYALDLGCGNGWFTKMLASSSKDVLGLDMNQTELEQAVRVFGSNQIQFCYGDVFAAELPKGKFNLITLNACFQYFPNAEKLISRLLELLSPLGEIHVIDSPIYKSGEVESAQKRTISYYTNLGFPDMAAHYFHHSWDSLKPHKFEVLHRPEAVKNKITKKLGIPSSPFPWIIIRR
jgi:ubiquinone/menaquinone biosynthesis C-methylase UbiE